MNIKETSFKTDLPVCMPSQHVVHQPEGDFIGVVEGCQDYNPLSAGVTHLQTNGTQNTANGAG